MKKSNTKIIIATGISGSGSRKFCASYKKLRKKVKIYNTGDMILELAQNDPETPNIPKENLLNLNPNKLKHLRDKAFDIISDEINNHQNKYERIIIDTHAKFFWNDIYYNAFDWKHLNKIPVDLFLTIIDKPSVIRENQKKHKAGLSQDHDFRDLLLWQNNEVDTTAGWASKYGKPFYVLPSRQNFSIIDSLLESKFLIYFSMPMTDADSEANDMVTNFKKKLLNLGEDINYLPTPIIDPRHIDIEPNELIMENVDGKNFLFKKAKRTVDRHTVHRDLNWYIPKATHIIAYYPQGTEVSKGVTDECTRAFETGKYVYVVFHRDNKSPFMELAHNVFRNEEEFFKFFPEHIEEQIRKGERKNNLL